MEKLLDKVDFEKYKVYSIAIDVISSEVFADGKENEVDEHGQSLDAVSDIRRSVKYSFPHENRKIIKTIVAQDEKEAHDGTLCRDINLEYYLLLDKEEAEELDLTQLRDTLEEEWHAGSDGCDIKINPYQA
ncbi:MAG: hypothetical protein Q9M32_07610 [Sulfurimonas sp.]|nr:hypothetical protein [Sulfurimonas sp.]MDQ7061321.1 hypothetical protein [Sulfurimonas sp.]